MRRAQLPPRAYRGWGRFSLQSASHRKLLCAAKLKQKSKTAKFSAKKILLPTQNGGCRPPSGRRSASASPQQPAFTCTFTFTCSCRAARSAPRPPFATCSLEACLGVPRLARSPPKNLRNLRENATSEKICEICVRIPLPKNLRNLREILAIVGQKNEGAVGALGGNETFCQTYCLTGISPRNTARPFWAKASISSSPGYTYTGPRKSTRWRNRVTM